MKIPSVHSLRAVFDDPVRVKIAAALCRTGFHESLEHRVECLLMLAIKLCSLVTDDLERLTETGKVLDAGHVCRLKELYGEHVIASTHGVYLASLGKDIGRTVFKHGVLILRELTVYAPLQLGAQFLICVTDRV